MKKLQAEIRFHCRYGFEDEPGSVKIEITDKASSIRVAEIEMDATQFMNACVGSSSALATITWRGVERLGWIRQHKTVHNVTEDNVHEFEVDGWKEQSGHLGNWHKRASSGDGYSVVFTRHVPPEEQEK